MRNVVSGGINRLRQLPVTLCCTIEQFGDLGTLPFLINGVDSPLLMIIPPGGSAGSAIGINDLGTVAGQYCGVSECESNRHHGFAYRGIEFGGAAFDIIDVPVSSSTAASGVNFSGTIVGAYCTNPNLGVCVLPPDPGPDSSHGFIDAAGVFTTVDFPGASATAINAINDAGDVAGVYAGPGAFHAFVRQQGVFHNIDPPGSLYAEALGINNAGAVVGTYLDSKSQQHGFYYLGGVLTTIDVPSGFSTSLTGINNAGVVVATYSKGTDPFTAEAVVALGVPNP